MVLMFGEEMIRTQWQQTEVVITKQNAKEKIHEMFELTFMSKSSKLANDDDPNESIFGPWDGRGGAGRGGGCFAFFGGNAGEGDSGAADPATGAWRLAKGSLPKASLPAFRTTTISYLSQR